MQLENDLDSLCRQIIKGYMYSFGEGTLFFRNAVDCC